jgi:hypothetical protein
MFYSFNAPHRIAMGLVPANEIKTVRHSGTYTVIGSEIERSGTHVLSIEAGGGLLGEDTHFFVEYRQPLAGSARSMASEVVVTAWTRGGDQPTYYLGSLNCRRTACESITLHHGAATLTVTAVYEGPTQARVRVEIQHSAVEQGAPLLVTKNLSVPTAGGKDRYHSGPVKRSRRPSAARRWRSATTWVRCSRRPSSESGR